MSPERANHLEVGGDEALPERRTIEPNEGSGEPHCRGVPRGSGGVPAVLLDREAQAQDALLAHPHDRDGARDAGEDPLNDRPALIEHESWADAPALEQVDDRGGAGPCGLLIVPEAQVDIVSGPEAR